MKLTEQQLGTVLAALRLWQRSTSAQNELGLWQIASNEGAFHPLLDEEIDELCEQINGEAVE